MKRKIWVTAGIAAALAFLIAFGAVGCVVSGFDLPLDSYAKVVLICGAASVFCAAAFSLKWGGAAVLCVTHDRADAAADMDAYLAVAADIQNYYAETLPAVALFWDAHVQAYNSRFDGFVVDGTFGIMNVQTWMHLPEN